MSVVKRVDGEKTGLLMFTVVSPTFADPKCPVRGIGISERGDVMVLYKEEPIYADTVKEGCYLTVHAVKPGFY